MSSKYAEDYYYKDLLAQTTDDTDTIYRDSDTSLDLHNQLNETSYSRSRHTYTSVANDIDFIRAKLAVRPVRPSNGPQTQSLQDLDMTGSTRRTPARRVRKLTQPIHRMKTQENSEDGDIYRGRRSLQGGLSEKTGSQKCLALDSLTYNFTKTKVFSSVSSLPSLPVSEDASYYIPDETYYKRAKPLTISNAPNVSAEAIAAENKELMAQIGIIRAEMNKYLGQNNFGEPHSNLINTNLSRRPDPIKKKVPVVDKEMEDIIAEYKYLSKRLVEIRDPMYMLALSEKKGKIMDQTIRARRAINRLRRMAAEDRKDIHAIEQGEKKSEILQEANDKLIEMSRIQRKTDQLKIKNKAFEREREVKEEREKELEDLYKNLNDINVHYFGGEIMIKTSLENLDTKMRAEYEEEEYSNTIEDTRKKYYKDQLKRDIESLAVQNRQYKENLTRLEDMVKDQRKMMYEMIEAAKIGNNSRVRAVLERNDWMPTDKADEEEEEDARRYEANYGTIGTALMTEITEKDEENLVSGQLNLARISYTPSSAAFTNDLSDEIRKLEDRYLNAEEMALKERALEASISSLKDMKASNADSSSSKNRILIRKVDIKKIDRKRESEEKKRTSVPEVTLMETNQQESIRSNKNDDDVVVVELERKQSEIAEKPVSVKNSMVNNKSEVKEMKEAQEEKMREMPVLRVIEASEVEIAAQERKEEVKEGLLQEEKKDVLEVGKEKTSETVVSIKVIPDTPQEKKEEESVQEGEVGERMKTDTTIVEQIEVEESVPPQSLMQSGMNKLDETIKSYLLSATFTKPVFLKRQDLIGRMENQEEASSAQKSAEEEVVASENEEPKVMMKEIETQTEETGVQTIPEIPAEEEKETEVDVAGLVKTAVKEKVSGNNNNNKTIKLVIECTVAVNDGEIQNIVEVKQEKAEKVEEVTVIAEKAIEKEEVGEVKKGEEEAVVVVVDVAKEEETQEAVQKEAEIVLIEKAVEEAEVKEEKVEVVEVKTEEETVKVEEKEEKVQEAVIEAEKVVQVEEVEQVPKEQKEDEVEIQAETVEKEEELKQQTEDKEEEEPVEMEGEVEIDQEEEAIVGEPPLKAPETEIGSDSMVAKSAAESNYQEEFEKETDKYSLSHLETASAKNITETPTYFEGNAQKSQEPVSAPVNKGVFGAVSEPNESFYEEIFVVDAETQTDADLEGYEEYQDGQLQAPTLEAKKSEVPISHEENVEAFGELTRMNRIKRGEKEIGTTTEPILERKSESEGTLTNSETQKIEESPVEKELMTAQIKGTERSATLWRAQNRSEKASAASQTPHERLRRHRPQLVSRGVEVNVGFERKEEVESAFSSSYWGDSVRGGNEEGSMAGSMLIRPEMNSIGVGTDEVMENKGSLMEGLDLEGNRKYRVMNVSLVRRTEDVPMSKEI